ncbi:MAG TPA: glycerol-3-phosphate dehydrogenase [Allosphingosinicella sp.]|uniref:glycerol-3-phosphate dehydrogenase n=1 Tax=Allosphingosinicella sp. TaxID=2823234 RepID=UPI002F27C3FE
MRDSFDLLIVGGGINGAAIARDAAMRGLQVLLVERDDLAQHTSSASSKLIHGGLRYLEQGALRLVRESLREREILLRTAPHIVRPLRFVLPQGEGGRPWWMLRSGLTLYDLLAGRSALPRSRSLAAGETAFIAPLRKPGRAALYHDAWVDDARLVVLNALAAAEHGAEIATRTTLLSARRDGEAWTVELSAGRQVCARAIVNAAGPWVADVLTSRIGRNSASRVRLIKGSHIVVPRLYDGDHAYILQQPDGRVVFALPHGEHNLIGTTDIPVERPEDATITPDEIAYLCAAVNLYFEGQTGPGDVRWSYSGVRSLHDDGAASAQAVTRDYHLELDDGPGPKLLSVFGGKITTARALADRALGKLGSRGRCRTRHAYLPGGEMDDMWDDSHEEFLATIDRWIDPKLSLRLACSYGARIANLLGTAGSTADLGRHFGADLYQLEVDYLRRVEWARTADDILWRRTKLGLKMSPAECEQLDAYLAARDTS